MKPNPFSLAAAEGAAPEGPTGATVDYRLARAATLRAWKSGQLSRHDVCDAQRELHRNAEFCGQPTRRKCPVCSEAERAHERDAGAHSPPRSAANLVEVTYVFGPWLPKHGRCVTTRAEMQRLQHRASVSTGFVVEVCTDCGWNHLVRRYTLGGKRSA